MININFKVANKEQIEKAIFRGTFIVMILIVFIILLSEIGIIRKETNKLIFAYTNSSSILNLETSQNPSL